MKRPLTCLTVLLCALSLLASPALAQTKQMAEVTPVTGEPHSIDLSPPYVVMCQVGNLNPAAWAIGGFLVPPESYWYVFDPTATCTVCSQGFSLTGVHILLQSAAACTLVMEARLADVAYLDPTCPLPGAGLCASGFYQVSLPGAGLWNVVLPINCDCMPVGGLYALGFAFQSSTCVPDLIADNFPSLCTSWNSFGSGTYDLVGDFAFPGNIKIWADAECCDVTPVRYETWGKIKEFYRR